VVLFNLNKFVAINSKSDEVKINNFLVVCDTILFKEVLQVAYYQRIRDLREDSDKTQADVAEYLGTTAQHYGKYENGNAEIPFERAIALAKYYNVSLDYIAGMTNNKLGLASSDLTDEQQALLCRVENMTDSEKKKAVELLKKLIEIMK